MGARRDDKARKAGGCGTPSPAQAILFETALFSLDSGADPLFDGFVAKARAGQAAGKVAAAVHQVLGAIGFSEEHALHRLTRRLWAWRDEWGRQSDCEEAVGRLAAKAGGDGLWPLIADEKPTLDHVEEEHHDRSTPAP